MGSAAVGMMISVASTMFEGYSTMKQAEYQAQVENQQLKIDAENERIRAMQEQNKRNEEYLKADSANRVAVAFSGARNISFEQGLSPHNRSKAYLDMQTIGFNSAMEIGRKKYQIKVNKFNATMTGRSAMIGAGLESAGTVASFLDGQAKAAAGSSGASGG
jgi:hypothetical protein